MEREQLFVSDQTGRPLDGQLDVSFLLNGFCIAGLPLRRPRDNTLVWKRQDGEVALTVRSLNWVTGRQHLYRWFAIRPKGTIAGYVACHRS